jgi:hypothetical protein
MTAAHHWLFVSLAGFAIGWILALRALSQIGALEMMLAVTFLSMIAWGVYRAANI